MVLHNPNNWHWVDKNCVPWSKTYLAQKLLVKASKGDVNVEITRLVSLDGDCDVCQRKGKVIGLYDLELELEFHGKNGDHDVKGKIKIPEVMYNTEEDEFVFDISIENESSETGPVKALLKSDVIPELRRLLIQYGVDLIAENGQTIQHKNEAETKSTSLGSYERKSEDASSTVNTAQVRLNPTFTASAEQLFEALTNPQMVAAWTRSAPEVFEPKVGGKFKVFGGNISGEFTKIDKPTAIEQKWRLKDWKEGHHSTVKFTMTQDVGITTLNVSWSGIPVGQEDVVKSNFTNYYVHPIMMTFGFGVPS